MCQKVVIPAVEPGARPFNRSCKPYLNLDSRFTIRCPGMTKRGFTLIELLVVVLIIGILASVALPQYQTAVARSRYQQLVLMGTAIAKAEQIYYMANGTYTQDFSALDFDFGSSLALENDSGTYNAISSKWGRCTLRDYATGSVQCSSSNAGVPEFGMYAGFTVRKCHAYYSKGDVAQRVCKLETNTTEPASSNDSYATYNFK